MSPQNKRVNLHLIHAELDYLSDYRLYKSTYKGHCRVLLSTSLISRKVGSE